MLLALAELGFEILGYALSLLVERRESDDGATLELSKTAIALSAVAIGFALGVFSLQVRAQTMLPYAWLRVASLIVAPLTSGTLARRAARRRNERGEPSSPQRHFLFAFALTLAFVLVRFTHATHVG